MMHPLASAFFQAVLIVSLAALVFMAWRYRSTIGAALRRQWWGPHG